MARRPEELRPRSRTIMWCVPRTVSTAITKCLSAIEGNQIWFEPFHFCELFAIEWDRNLDMKLPLDYIGNEDAYQTILDALAKVSPVHYKPEYISFASVKRLLDRAVSSSSSHVFVKDIAFKFDKFSSCLPEGYKHTFLIRHPLRAIYSYRKALYKQFLERGGLKGSAAKEETFDVERDNPEFSCFNENQYAMWKYIRENVDSHPIVMDSDEFLANPSEMLPKYCRAVGLPYAESLLTWDASGDVVKSWRVPADDLFEHTPNFFDTAIRSCKFFPASEISRDHVTPDVIRYTDRVLKYYEEMYESRIRLT